MVLHSINENEPIPLESDQRELIVIPPVRGSLLPLKLNLEANGKVISNEEPTGKRLDSGICMTESSGLHCRQDGFKMVQEEPNPVTTRNFSCFKSSLGLKFKFLVLCKR